MALLQPSVSRPVRERTHVSVKARLVYIALLLALVLPSAKDYAHFTWNDQVYYFGRPITLPYIVMDPPRMLSTLGMRLIADRAADGGIELRYDCTDTGDFLVSAGFLETVPSQAQGPMQVPVLPSAPTQSLRCDMVGQQQKATTLQTTPNRIVRVWFSVGSAMPVAQGVRAPFTTETRSLATDHRGILYDY